MVIVTCAGTGWPFRVAGSYRYSFKEATAGERSEGGPESMLTRFTSPAVPTTASTTTFPVSKSRRASMGARARTDLISLGGTMPLSPAAAAFDAKPDKGGVFFPAGCTLELFGASECAGGSAASLGSAGSGLRNAVLPAGVFAAAKDASLATFVLLISECTGGPTGLPGSDDFSFAATTSEPTAPFCASGFRRSQCLDHAAPATVAISADTNRPRRSAPPRKLGVKLPRARNDRLAFGNDLLKSSDGIGSIACSSAVHWAAGFFSIGRDLAVKTLADTSCHRPFAVDPVFGTSPALGVGVSCGTVLIPVAGTC